MYTIKIKKTLQEFAKKYKLRNNWHEPDEHDVDAIITGTHLDNAFGDNLILSPPSYHQEYVVHLTVKDSVKLSINLADLLAIACREG